MYVGIQNTHGADVQLTYDGVVLSVIKILVSFCAVWQRASASGSPSILHLLGHPLPSEAPHPQAPASPSLYSSWLWEGLVPQVAVGPQHCLPRLFWSVVSCILVVKCLQYHPWPYSIYSRFLRLTFKFKKSSWRIRLAEKQSLQNVHVLMPGT